ncbi:MAG: hypothetical protein JWP80_127 [Pseudomonas sp.]|nr:hypothetical protein [Pseudomonas sp.]
MADSLNCIVYLRMKNTPEVGWVSNFWGALQISVGAGLPAKADCQPLKMLDVTDSSQASLLPQGLAVLH